MSQATQMRGLTQYISELRACATREAAERRVHKEMAHVRLKLGAGAKLDGYQRKKYVAKVLFTYLQGFSVDVGDAEILTLLHSTRYSEKQIVRAAPLTPPPGLPRAALPWRRARREHAWRACGDAARPRGPQRGEHVPCAARARERARRGPRRGARRRRAQARRVAVRPAATHSRSTSSTWVQKKAALTLAHLYRVFPEGVRLGEWSAHLARLVRHRNLGVSLSAAHLLCAVVRDDPHVFRACYRAAVDQLHQVVVDEDYKEIYLFHGLPVPWLQAALLRLLQRYPPTADAALLARLDAVLGTVLRVEQRADAADVQQRNAATAVVLEAVRLALHLGGALAPTAARAAVRLGVLVDAEETNVRYVGLAALAQLAPRLPTPAPLHTHRRAVRAAVWDSDAGVRRAALELVVALCDAQSVRSVVAYLLDAAPHAAPPLRARIVEHIAALAAQDAGDDAWYVDTMFAAVRVADAHAGARVWPRVVHVVAQRTHLHAPAAARALDALRAPGAAEALVQLGAYALGEWGACITAAPGASPHAQLRVLQEHAELCTPPTRAMLLTTYAKWLAVYPELRAELVALLCAYTDSVDAEVQQRACEYVALAELNDPALLELVYAEMPPAPLPAPERTLRAPPPAARTLPLSGSVARGLARAAGPAAPLVPLPCAASPASPADVSAADLLDLRDCDDDDAAVPAVRAEDWSSVSLFSDAGPDEKRETDSLLDVSLLHAPGTRTPPRAAGATDAAAAVSPLSSADVWASPPGAADAGPLPRRSADSARASASPRASSDAWVAHTPRLAPAAELPHTPEAPARAPNTPEARARAPNTLEAPALAPNTPEAPALAPHTPKAPALAPRTPEAPAASPGATPRPGVVRASPGATLAVPTSPAPPPAPAPASPVPRASAPLAAAWSPVRPRVTRAVPAWLAWARSGVWEAVHDDAWRVTLTYAPLALHVTNDGAAGEVRAADLDGAAALALALAAPVPGAVAPHATWVGALGAACAACFTHTPRAHITLARGAAQRTYAFDVPLTLAYFVRPAEMHAADAAARWRALAGAEREASCAVRGVADDVRAVLGAANLYVVHGEDEGAAHVVGAGVFRSAASGPVACLVRYEARADGAGAQLTVRTTHGAVSAALRALLADALGE
ncbi:hypothetical protein GLX27_003802 [Malassezia furfur]|uniref:AP-2 complex subunit alpha n=1 Tax=Malassezia furfur TaxID=55194 RepID=A0ABY8EUC9_MALFU|nr:hypothetical protein GLX27_003802 [Malassezia furfur]